ncbi:hypothetical protein EYR36_005479 [Pleurotus pulmonarius]|nr:hypothetical protein EYR36_005479 [Pleurotus pulmonarius]
MITQIIAIAILASSFVKALGGPDCALKEFGAVKLCLVSACPEDQIHAAIQTTKEFCSNAGAPLSLGSGPSTVSGSATHMTQNTPVTSSLSTTPAYVLEISPTQITKDAASQNANDAAPRNLNVVAGLIAFGLVALAV